MAELSEEQKKALEEQKKQCPFCQIITGKIPAKKIYEDDKVIAVLDINPAAKGHTLIMPKEHYPIMPLIPKETFAHLFKIVRDISKTLKKSLLMQGTNVFIANGGVAGQQSGHFMVHIIPREESDGFSGINLKEGKVDEAKVEELEKMLKHNLPLMLKDFYAKHPIEGKESALPKLDKAQVIKIIEQNTQLLELLKHNPDMVKKAIPGNEQLKALFDIVPFDEIVAHFGGKSKEEDSPEDQEESEDETEKKEEPIDKPKKVKKQTKKKVKKKESPKKENEDEPEDDNASLDDIARLFG